MDKYEVEVRLAEELGGNIHLNPLDRNHIYSEEEYQELKAFIIRLDEKKGRMSNGEF